MGPAGDPGAVLVVVDAAGVIHCRGFGHDVQGEALTCRTPIAVASLTKGFTALAIMRSLERGCIRLTAPVRAYVPWFRPADPAPITVLDLLQQRSGFTTQDGKRWLASGAADAAALERRVRDLNGARLFAPPGTVFAYSNANYAALGSVLERVTGKPYAQLMRELVLAPLGVRDARIGREAALRGHNRWFSVPVAALGAPRDAGDDPAAGLTIDALDLGRYLSAQVDEGRSWSAQLLSRDDWRQLHTSPNNAPYAMGWYDLIAGGKHVYRHDGLAPDFHAFAVFSPSERLGAALLVNASEEPDGGRRVRFDIGLQRLLFGGTPEPQPWLPSDIPLRLLALAGAIGLLAGIRDALRARGMRVLIPGSIAAAALIAIWALILPLMGGTLAVGLAYAPDLSLMLAAIVGLCSLTVLIVLVRAFSFRVRLWRRTTQSGG